MTSKDDAASNLLPRSTEWFDWYCNHAKDLSWTPEVARIGLDITEDEYAAARKIANERVERYYMLLTGATKGLPPKRLEAHHIEKTIIPSAWLSIKAYFINCTRYDWLNLLIRHHFVFEGFVNEKIPEADSIYAMEYILGAKDGKRKKTDDLNTSSKRPRLSDPETEIRRSGLAESS